MPQVKVSPQRGQVFADRSAIAFRFPGQMRTLKTIAANRKRSLKIPAEYPYSMHAAVPLFQPNLSSVEKIMRNLTRCDPFDDLFRGFFVRPVEMGSPVEAPTIKIDVKEKGGDYLVHAELPGIKKDDIHVNIDGALVSISAEREKEVREGERVLRSERYFGKVSRSFQLGQDIDEDKSSAKFNDGVLELTLPKKSAAAVKRLSIQ